MVLQKQPLELIFGQGIDTKNDPKTLPSGNLLILENGVLKKRNRIDKRNGYTAFGNTLVDGTSLPSGDNLATFKDELLLYADQKLYSYSESTNKWVDKGNCVSAIITTNQVVKNTYAQTQSDSAVLNGIAVFAYEDSRGGVRATVIDNEKNTAILSDVSIDSSGSRARVIGFQNYIHVYYYKSGSLYVRRINASVPSSFETAVQVVSDVNTTNSTYDIVDFPIGQRLLLAYNVQSATQTNVCFVDVDGVVYTGTLAGINFAEAATNSIAAVVGESNTIYIAYHNSTNALRCRIFNAGLTSLQPVFTLNSTTATAVVNITGYSTASGITFFYEQTAAATYNRVVRSVTALSTGAASGDAVFLRSVGLASKSWAYDSRGFVGLVHDSTLQSTFFVARDDGLIIGKQKYGVAGGVMTRTILPAVSTVDTTKFKYSLITKNQLVSENATLYTVNGVSQTEVDFSANDIFTSAEIGNNLLICGGTLQNYDGQSVTEHNFHLFPENFTVSHVSAGGNIASGTYQYIVVYEWTDNQGQLHRSAPSIAVSTGTISGSNNTVTITVPTLRLTEKKGTRAPISIAVYRTEDAGTIFYRVSSVSSPSLNDTTVDTIAITDTLADSSIISREILYTTGGILENFSPGSCSCITIFKNRVVIGGLENKFELNYSKIVETGSPPEFAQEFTIVVDEKGQRINSLGVLDEKIVIFKSDRFYITYGDGPDKTGFNGSFATPEFVSSDVGCVAVQSIAQIPGAITFKSDKGIYLLDSSVQVKYFGAPVEEYNDKIITSAILKADSNQIRFTTLDGPCLVYDYFFQQWSIFTNHEGKDATIWNNKYIYLRETGDVLKETEGIYKDVDAPFRLKVGTAWLSLAGINGFQRAYRFALLGEYKTPHLLRIKAGYDFSSSLETVMLFDPVSDMEIGVFGEDSPFGSGSPFGGDNISYRVRGHLPRQKCQSIRFVIEELSTSATEGTGEALTLSGMTVLVGLKSALTKLKESQSVG